MSIKCLPDDNDSSLWTSKGSGTTSFSSAGEHAEGCWSGAEEEDNVGEASVAVMRDFENSLQNWKSVNVDTEREENEESVVQTHNDDGNDLNKDSLISSGTHSVLGSGIDSQQVEHGQTGPFLNHGPVFNEVMAQANLSDGQPGLGRSCDPVLSNSSSTKAVTSKTRIWESAVNKFLILC